jgi:EAL domain-containing protein (putative c-di-GMP-specific phosphodiesterase class I)
VDTIKIDRSFVLGMTGERVSRAIVQATIELGHTLGLRVVAEGIESADVASELLAMGCDLGQGYHFGRPVQAAELTDALTQLASAAA